MQSGSVARIPSLRHIGQASSASRLVVRSRQAAAGMPDLFESQGRLSTGASGNSEPLQSKDGAEKTS